MTCIWYIWEEITDVRNNMEGRACAWPLRLAKCGMYPVRFLKNVFIVGEVMYYVKDLSSV